MSWPEVFLVFLACHLAGDFVLQTEFQATKKVGGLGRDPVARRALLAHVATYAIPFVPAAVVLTAELGALGWIGVVVLLVEHLVQDDGRLVRWWAITVKKVDPAPGTPLWIAVDQSFHVLTLFVVALVVAG